MLSERKIFWSAAIVCGVSRFAAMARSLWDWDEALFCLGLRDYDVTLHHPHPPGFPVYIGLARLVRLIVDSDFRALQAINLFAGMLAFPAVYMLARELGLRFQTSVVAGALFAFFPNVWFYSGTAFSDVSSIVLAVFAAAFLLRGRRSRRDYFVGTLLLALAAGIRPQNLLIGLFPGIVATVRRRPWEIAVALLAGVTITGGAYAAAVTASGTLEGYVAAIRAHNDYIWRIDSFLNPERPPLWRISDRFFLKQYQSPILSVVTSLFVLISIGGAIRRRDRTVLYAILTFAPFAIMAWLMLDRYSISRFSIGYAPMFALLAADGIRRVSGTREFTIGAALVAAFIVWTFPPLGVIRRELSPPVLAIEAVQKEIDPRREQLFVGYSMSPFVEYFLPSLPVIRVMADHRAIPLTPTTSPFLLAEGPGGVFRRERGRLWNIARRHYFEVVLKPIRDHAEFEEGWSPPERSGMDEWRWMRRRGEIRLPPLSGEAMLRLFFAIPKELLPGQPRVRIVLNGRTLDDFVAQGEYVTRDYEVVAAEANVLELSIDKTMPDDHGIQLRFLTWGPK